VIETSHLTKNYGRARGIADVSLQIGSGSIFGLLGKNGAGKTTTFKCMLGLTRPSSGEVRFNGKPLVPEMRENIAYVPEQSVLYPFMTSREHCAMMRQDYRNFDQALCEKILSDFGIDARKPVRTLSKGMRTSVSLALALARNPEILFLDEPTSGLDPVAQHEVLELLVREAARGSAVVLSSHQVAHLESIADHVGIMEKGRLINLGSLDDFKANQKIVECVVLEGMSRCPRLVSCDEIIPEAEGNALRFRTRTEPEMVARELERMGYAGVRVLDLSLEAIFLHEIDSAVIRTALSCA
jgi:ABC-2 type transport system ATP-binding protein